MGITEALDWTKKTAAITAFGSAAIWGANFGIARFNRYLVPFLSDTFVGFLDLGKLGKSLLSAQNLMIVAFVSQSASWFMDGFQDKGQATQLFINNSLHGISDYAIAIAGACLTKNMLGRAGLSSSWGVAINCASALGGGVALKLFDDYVVKPYISDRCRIASNYLAEVYCATFTAAHNIIEGAPVSR
jgi:hypothetical protein